VDKNYDRSNKSNTMTKIVRFLWALGLLATMLASSVLSSKDGAEKLEPQPQGILKEGTPNQEIQTDDSYKEKLQGKVKEQPIEDVKPDKKNEIPKGLSVSLPSDI
jgi:hypothetical protein